MDIYLLFIFKLPRKADGNRVLQFLQISSNILACLFICSFKIYNSVFTLEMRYCCNCVIRRQNIKFLNGLSSSLQSSKTLNIFQHLSKHTVIQWDYMC